MKVKKKGSDLYLLDKHFDLKITGDRNVMLRPAGKNQFQTVGKIPLGMSEPAKIDFLMEINHKIKNKMGGE